MLCATRSKHYRLSHAGQYWLSYAALSSYSMFGRDPLFFNPLRCCIYARVSRKPHFRVRCPFRDSPYYRVSEVDHTDAGLTDNELSCCFDRCARCIPLIRHKHASEHIYTLFLVVQTFPDWIFDFNIHSPISRLRYTRPLCAISIMGIVGEFENTTWSQLCLLLAFLVKSPFR